jgi:hypothetical protein
LDTPAFAAISSTVAASNPRAAKMARPTPMSCSRRSVPLIRAPRRLVVAGSRGVTAAIVGPARAL